jgi:hypothetical protein
MLPTPPQAGVSRTGRDYENAGGMSLMECIKTVLILASAWGQAGSIQSIKYLLDET